MSQQLSVDIARDVRAPAAARRAVERLSFLERETLDDVKLLVSELVTNAIKYGEGAVHLNVMSSGADRVRVEVVDGGGGFVVPKVRDRPATEVGGWGLPTVEAIADRWGVYEGSTHVWFELDRHPPAARSGV